MTLVTRVGCHLCAQAEHVVRGVLAELDLAAGAIPVTLALLDVDGDLGIHESARAEWSELVPVLLIDDAVHSVIRVDPERLRATLSSRRRRWLW